MDSYDGPDVQIWRREVERMLETAGEPPWGVTYDAEVVDFERVGQWFLTECIALESMSRDMIQAPFTATARHPEWVVMTPEEIAVELLRACVDAGWFRPDKAEIFERTLPALDQSTAMERWATLG